MRDGELHEIKSSIILQPGPAALTDGVRELHRVIAAWAGGAGLSDHRFAGQSAQRLVVLRARCAAMTSAGSRGPGGRLSQSSVSR